MYDTEWKANLYKEWGEANAKNMQCECVCVLCMCVCEFLTLDGVVEYV